MNDTLIRGDLVELRCITDFQKRGYYCSIPFSGSCRYDVVVDINNKLYRIQCKSSSEHLDEGTLIMNATRSTTNTKQTNRYSYTKEEIDFFFTYWKEYSFLIPIEEVSTAKTLRIKEPKNGIQTQMSIAADYLLDNVIDSIISNKDIERYTDNRFISIDNYGNEHQWSTEELNQNYNERQIRYIKECISKEKMGYNLKWKYKEFPSL